MNGIFNFSGPADLIPGGVLLIAFLLGSIPFGLLIARIFHIKDLTTKGSGNIGATNVSRVGGFWPAGFLTFVLDVSKGVLAVFFGMSWGWKLIGSLVVGGADAGFVEPGIVLSWMAGLMAVLGHCYSPWLHFRGGKGVATGLGVMLMLSPISGLAGIIGFGLTFIHKRISSLSSIAGLILATATYLVFNPVGVQMWVGAALIFVILIRHEANIDALLENREKSFR